MQGREINAGERDHSPATAAAHWAGVALLLFIVRACCGGEAFGN
ncbi:MAG: hypothetical protein ACP5Q0_04930 [Halothiobacillus sp.]